MNFLLMYSVLIVLQSQPDFADSFGLKNWSKKNQ